MDEEIELLAVELMAHFGENRHVFSIGCASAFGMAPELCAGPA